MSENKLLIIEKLIEDGRTKEAQVEISKLGSEYWRNAEYLYLRSKLLFSEKIYYLAIDTLLISLEFAQSDKIYKLLSEIYGILGNKDLSKRLLDLNLRTTTVNSLKDELSGIYRKKSS